MVPANVKDILLLERVQRHATKYILNNYSHMSYAERCINLSILPLCFRREIIDLVLFYKYLHNYVDCDFSSYFELVVYFLSKNTLMTSICQFYVILISTNAARGA